MLPAQPRPVEDHRGDREAGAIVYPVLSRRSGGLSLGINLFPDVKRCSFDCPYCEVFPFVSDLRFSLPALERGLRRAVAEAGGAGLPVKDVCFSGNGEPTLSEDFPEALGAAARLRDELCPSASLVVITNASTLSDGPTSSFLRQATAPRSEGGHDLDLWVKVDAGTEAWYRAMDRSALPYDVLIRGISEFLASAPGTIQTMLCAFDGHPPPPEEEEAWLDLALRLTKGGGVRRFHLYGKARPAPEDPKTEPLPTRVLEARGEKLRSALARAGWPMVPVEVFP